MTKKTLGYVHLEWTCPNCQTRNPGPNSYCTGCGAPQPQDVEFEQAAEEKLVTDAEEIARAQAGPDVHCPYCNSRNPGNAKFCGACGGDLTEALARERGRVLGAHRDKAAEDLTCPSCGTANPATNRSCSNCGARLDQIPTPTAAPVEPPLAPRPRKWLPIAALLGGGALCAVAAIALFALVIKTDQQTAQVSAVRWERSIPIEALALIEREDWYDQIPADAEVGSCRSEHRYTSDEPTSDSIEVCGTPYTVDTGSGFGEVVQDCVYEVYDDWCTYSAMDWQSFDVITLSGTDLQPRWPEIALADDQRAGEPTEEYEVTFLTDGETYTYAVEDASEFGQFAPGSAWILNVNALGGVASVEPAP